MSQLLIRLEGALALETDPIQHAEIVARLACAYARVGRFAEAQSAVGNVRKTFGDGRSGRVTIMIMLAEATILFYQDLSPAALDRITRAQFLAKAIRAPSLIALTSAWKAQIEFERSQFDRMIHSLKLAMSSATDGDHDANARVAIILCNSYLLCGDRRSAQHWFLRARESALADGDQASIEALLYNRAAFGLAALRADRCLGRGIEADLRGIRLEIESAKNLQDLTGVASLTNHIRLWDARLLTLEGSFAAAIILLSRVRDQKPFASYNFSASLIDLEIAFCLIQLGKATEAYEVFRAVRPDVMDKLDVDEELAATWMLVEMSKVDRRFQLSDSNASRLAEVAKAYVASRDFLASELAVIARS